MLFRSLDGGHILYAISPRVHKTVTSFLPILLFVAGTVFWVGWMLWGIFLLVPAMRHPKVATDPAPTPGRIVLGIVGLAIFMLTFTTTPFDNNSLIHFFHLDPFRTAP